MRLTLPSFGVFLVFMAVVASQTSAAIVAHDSVRIYSWGGLPLNSHSPPTLHQTPYQVKAYSYNTPTSGSSAVAKENFLTFCVERTENFFNGELFKNIDGLSNITKSSGFTLTGYTAWVAEVFHSRYGDLNPNRTWNGQTTASGQVEAADLFSITSGRYKADLYQEAVWAGMVKLAPLQQVANAGSLIGTLAGSEFYVSATEAQQLHSIGIAYSDYLTSGWGLAGLNYTGGYTVVNIPTNVSAGVNLAFGQDQLFRPDGGPVNPPPLDPGNPIPLPPAILIWSVFSGFSLLTIRSKFVGRRSGLASGWR